jgi:hypothetical protein
MIPMDNDVFIISGLACLIAALVGGGLKAFGIEIPILKSVARQIALGLLGLILIIVGVCRPPRPPLLPPEAAFEYPAPNANISLKTQLRGTVKPAIPQDGGHYWLVIRDDDGDHYPQAEIAAMPNGTWTHPMALGPKWRGRPVDVLVVFAHSEQANEVLHRSVGGEGLSKLPNNVVPLATLNLTAHP